MLFWHKCQIIDSAILMNNVYNSGKEFKVKKPKRLVQNKYDDKYAEEINFNP